MSGGDDESSFADLFAKLGIEGNGEEEPSSTEATLPDLKSVVLAYQKRSGNKVVTTVRDIPDELQNSTLKQIKKSLGTGGSVVEGQLHIQGDRRRDLCAWFENRGVKVRGERG